MFKFSKFIKDIVLPEVVDKERRKKILDDGIIRTWKKDEEGRKIKEAREIAKQTYRNARSRNDKNDE
tara:strand:- start:98 stop:298 length:201 start_codon:yes stop_codon:yes gene_type:complete